MDCIKLDLPDSFFEEEVRCGHKITREMKKIWAVQLDMLNELDKVCQKHNLRYFADSGTLIGAIRHGGYIPWDDDIDVVMFRDDYEKLCAVAEQEFKPPIFFQTPYTDKGYVRGHAQMRNSMTTGCILDDLNKSFNRGIFIDIFVMDNLPDDLKARRKMERKVRFFWKVVYNGIGFDRKDPHSWRGRLLWGPTHRLAKIIGYDKLFCRYEKLCSRYNHCDTKYCSYIAYKLGSDRHTWERKWFEKTRRVPFEGLSVVIPEGYDARLRKEYGDYMVIKHTPTIHGETIFDPDTPYNVKLAGYSELKQLDNGGQ